MAEKITKKIFLNPNLNYLTQKYQYKTSKIFFFCEDLFFFQNLPSATFSDFSVRKGDKQNET